MASCMCQADPHSGSNKCMGSLVTTQRTAYKSSDGSLVCFDDDGLKGVNTLVGKHSKCPNEVACAAGWTPQEWAAYEATNGHAWLCSDGASAAGEGTCVAMRNWMVPTNVPRVSVFATCVKYSDAVTVRTAQGGVSATADDQQSSVNCPSGSTMTGCSCMSSSPKENYGCDGALIQGSTCKAYNANGKSTGVLARATCLQV